MGINFYRTPKKLLGEHNCPMCDAGFKPKLIAYEGVWKEDKCEWQTLMMTEKEFNALQKLKKEYKKKYDTSREPFVIVREKAPNIVES